MADKHICVAIYMTHDQADEAFSRLQAKDFNLELLSFVGRDSWEDMIGSRQSGRRFVHAGTHGPFWERLWSILPGWGVFWMLESGPVLVAGPLARTIMATQDDGDGHHDGDGYHDGDGHHDGSRFVRALSRTHIPEDSTVAYEKALMKDQILVFIEGTLDDINVVQGLLNETKAINHTVHHGIGGNSHAPPPRANGANKLSRTGSSRTDSDTLETTEKSDDE
jgi:hypothetical protein